MKYGAMNFPVKPLLEEIEEIGRMGFDYVEITMDPPEATPQKISAQKRQIQEMKEGPIRIRQSEIKRFTLRA